MIRGLSLNNQFINYLKFHTEQLVNVIESTRLIAYPPNPYDRFNIVKNCLNGDNLTINKIFSLEQELVRLYPDEFIPYLYQETKDRYIKVLPNEALDKIKQIETPLPPNNQPTELRNRTISLYGHLQKYYFFINERERFIREMKTNFIAMLFILAILTLLASIFCFYFQDIFQLSLMFGMICGGYLGAIISTVRRIQTMVDAPIDGVDREAILLKIYQGKRGIYLSILLGACSPFVIYLLLRLVPADKGFVIFGISFIPVFSEPVIHIQPTVSELYLNPILRDAKDIAKILFISILSGFSERLIPDVLDRISTELNYQFKNQNSQKRN